HVRSWRAGRWTRLARRPVLAPFEPDQQCPRGLAPRGGRPARLDPTLAGARRELDLGRQRDDLGGRVQCDRRAGGLPRGRLRDEAYQDVPLPIGSGQTISAPSMIAIMLEEAALEPGERVLEIGTGSGYHAALLAAIVGTKNVVSIERHAGLADRAKANLAATG